MNNNVFVYIEFENLEPSGHRLNIANAFVKKLRKFENFGKFIMIVKKHGNENSILQEKLAEYDKVEFALSDLKFPNSSSLNIIDVSTELYKILNKLIESKMNYIIYTHMPSPFALLSLYFAIHSLVKEGKTNIKVITRMCMIDEEWSWYRFRLSKIIDIIKKDVCVSNFFYFTAESIRLIDYYKKQSNIDMILQFNPLPEYLISLTRRKHYYHQAIYGNLITFLYIGEAREEKGFHLLPNFIKSLKKTEIPFRFIIHSFSNIQNNTSLIQQTRSELEKLQKENPFLIKLICYPVPNSIYFAHMCSADVVVMPYSPISYRIRGSGIGFESVFTNCFILVNEDTDIYETFKNSGRVIPYDFSSENIEILNGLFSKVIAERKKLNSKHPVLIFEPFFFENALFSIIDKECLLPKSIDENYLEKDYVNRLIEIFSYKLNLEETDELLKKNKFFLT